MCLNSADHMEISGQKCSDPPSKFCCGATETRSELRDTKNLSENFELKIDFRNFRNFLKKIYGYSNIDCSV